MHNRSEPVTHGYMQTEECLLSCDDEGYLLRAFLLVTLPLPTVVLDRATLGQGVLLLVLRGGGPTAVLQQLWGEGRTSVVGNEEWT